MDDKEGFYSIENKNKSFNDTFNFGGVRFKINPFRFELLFPYP